MYKIPNSTYLFYFLDHKCLLDLSKRNSLSSENIRDKLQQVNSEIKNNIRSEMKEMKEKLDILTASLEENKDEG